MALEFHRSPFLILRFLRDPGCRAFLSSVPHSRSYFLKGRLRFTRQRKEVVRTEQRREGGIINRGYRFPHRHCFGGSLYELRGSCFGVHSCFGVQGVGSGGVNHSCFPLGPLGGVVVPDDGRRAAAPFILAVILAFSLPHPIRPGTRLFIPLRSVIRTRTRTQAQSTICLFRFRYASFRQEVEEESLAGEKNQAGLA